MDADGSIDPADLYSMDDYLVEQDILDDLGDHLVAEMQSFVSGIEGARTQRGPRRYLDRPREQASQQLMDDYFSPNPVYNETQFRRRFRMRRPLFLKIVEALSGWSEYFTQRPDALNRPGFSPIHKCTVAMRQLAYGGSADQHDEYLKIGESTGVECLKKFVQGIIEVYGEEYLRRPTVEDLERLLKESERRGFPGKVGSIDCMHWPWEKCPYGWKGQYTRGDHGVPTIILEAVASHDRWIWHAFFGVAGSNNDINVLNQSTLFVDQLRGEGPQVEYFVNGTQYTQGYYLADGIYPPWAVFVKSIRSPQSAEHKLFSEYQEGERKEVECAFGILQSRFSILRRPARLYEQGDLENIMLACIILHNMIIEDERDIEDDSFDLNEEASTSTVQPPTIVQAQDPIMAEVLKRDAEIRDQQAHKQLQSDLIAHIWNKFGNRTN
jgi:hypothetical protein